MRATERQRRKERQHALQLLMCRMTRVELETADLVSRINRGFLALISNWPVEPCAWSFNTISKPGQPPDYDTGLFQSTGNPDPTAPNETKDHKITFHFRASLIEKLALFNPVFLAKHGDLIAACQALLRRCQNQLRGIVRELDQLLGTKLARRIGRAGNEAFDVLRILAYTSERLDAAQRGVIGRPHNDRDAWTFALDESGPGLQRALAQDMWEPMSSAPNAPLLFNSCKAYELSGRRLKPLFHRIVRVPQPRVHPSALRTSIIAFLHTQGYELPSDYDTHTYIK